METKRFEAWLRPVGALVCGTALYVAIGDPLRIFEGRAMAALSTALSDRTYQVGARPYVMVIDRSSELGVWALVPTRSCSAAAAISVVVALTVFLLRGPAWRKGLAIAGGCALVVSFNLGRLVSMALLGPSIGQEGVVTFHDWAGTGITLVGIVVAVFVAVRTTSGGVTGRHRETTLRAGPEGGPPAAGGDC